MDITRYKYGRTFHFPWSQGVGSDDKIFKTNQYRSSFEYKQYVITVKMDGENTCLYSDGYTHARSVENVGHVSRDWVKAFWGERYYNLPKGWRVYGENVYAQHSIEYNDLDSYFNAFSIYDDNNIRLDWDVFEEWCQLLDIKPVPVLYISDDGMSFECEESLPNQTHLQSLFDQVVADGHEGIVMTTYNGFAYEDMSKYVIKAVRRNHVQTDEHWMHATCVPNKLKESNV